VAGRINAGSCLLRCAFADHLKRALEGLITRRTSSDRIVADIALSSHFRLATMKQQISLKRTFLAGSVPTYMAQEHISTHAPQERVRKKKEKRGRER